MRKVERFIAFDGTEHPTQREAVKHNDEQFGQHVTRLAGELVHISKYTEFCNWIESNIDTFALMRDIRDDSSVVVDED